MNPSEISELIEAGFENADVKVVSDDNTHFAALVVAATPAEWQEQEGQ